MINAGFFVAIKQWAPGVTDLFTLCGKFLQLGLHKTEFLGCRSRILLREKKEMGNLSGEYSPPPYLISGQVGLFSFCFVCVLSSYSSTV